MAKATDKNDINIFAQRLGDLIKENGYTHENVAQGIGVTRQGVGKWVSGESVPDVLTAAKLAKFFNVSVDYLSGNSNIKTSNMNLQAVCAFTGLNEDAVENIINRTSMPKPIYDKHTKTTYSATIFTPEYYEDNKKVLNMLLSCPWFWEIIFNYVYMENINQKSFSLQENYIKARKLFCEGAKSDVVYEAAEKAIQNYNDIDVARYAITRLIEKISDIFDCRENSTTPSDNNTNTDETQLPF